MAFTDAQTLIWCVVDICTNGDWHACDYQFVGCPHGDIDFVWGIGTPCLDLTAAVVGVVGGGTSCTHCRSGLCRLLALLPTICATNRWHCPGNHTVAMGALVSYVGIVCGPCDCSCRGDCLAAALDAHQRCGGVGVGGAGWGNYDIVGRLGATAGGVAG